MWLEFKILLLIGWFVLFLVELLCITAEKMSLKYLEVFFVARNNQFYDTSAKLWVLLFQKSSAAAITFSMAFCSAFSP